MISSLGAMSKAGSLCLVRATPADGQRLVDFLVLNYYPHEPLNLAINQAVGKLQYPNDDDFQYVLQFLPQGRTLLAVEGDQLLGVAVLREITPRDRDAWPGIVANSKQEDEKEFYKFYYHLEKKAGFWEVGGPQKALDLHILSVSVERRGTGIGKILIQAGQNLAREQGYQLFRMDCSSFYSARLAEALGMMPVHSVPYDEYKNEDGDIVFKVPEPHKELVVFKLKL